MAKAGDTSHIDQLERYIFGEISLEGVQNEADLKRKILELYERDNKVGKNAQGIKSYARNDWHNKPTASNIYQTTLEEIRSAEQQVVDELNKIEDYDTLREFRKSRKVTELSPNAKSLLRLRENEVAAEGVRIYEQTLNRIESSTNYDTMSRIDLRELENRLTRQQFIDLRAAYNDKRTELKEQRFREREEGLI